MKSIPIDIINYICEFAAGENKLWYPFFCPKTEKLSWKINRYCSKYILNSRCYINTIREIRLTFYNSETLQELLLNCNMLRFNNIYNNYIKKYIQFFLESPNGIITIEGMISAINNNGLSYNIRFDTLYFDRIPRANISFGWISSIDLPTERITIGYETY
jgi:hypothetical protein